MPSSPKSPEQLQVTNHHKRPKHKSPTPNGYIAWVCNGQKLEERWDARVDIRPRLLPDDRRCPIVQARKYNGFQRQKARYYGKLGASEKLRREKEIKEKAPEKERDREGFDRNIQVNAAELATNVSFQQSQSQSPMELEIVQKIVIRESFLAELRRLCKYQDRLTAVKTEIQELVKVVRGQTLDIVEQIQAWAAVKEAPAPFLFKNCNYVVKMEKDFNFLGSNEEVTAWLGCSLLDNPLAIPDSVPNATMLTVDGLSYTQLKEAAKYIRDEKFRIYPIRDNDAQGQGGAEQPSSPPIVQSASSPALLDDDADSPPAPTSDTNPPRMSTKAFRSTFKRSRQQHQQRLAQLLQQSAPAMGNLHSLLNTSASIDSNFPSQQPGSPQKWQADLRRKRNRIAQLVEAVYREKQRISEQKEVVAELSREVAVIDNSRAALEVKRQEVPPNSTALFQQLTIKLHTISVQLEDANKALKQAQQILFNLRTECRRKQQLVAKLEGDIENMMVEREKQRIMRSLIRQQVQQQEREQAAERDDGEADAEEVDKGNQYNNGGESGEDENNNVEHPVQATQAEAQAQAQANDNEAPPQPEPESPTMPKLTYEEMLELHFNSAVKWMATRQSTTSRSAGESDEVEGESLV